MQHADRREVGGGEARGHDDGVVERRLVERDEEGERLVERDDEGERLAGVDVEGVVHVLHGVDALHLHQPEPMALDPDVDGGPEPDVGDAEEVGPAAGADERRRRAGAIDEQAVGRRERGAGIEALPELAVAGPVPVPDEEREVPRGRRVGDGDGGALVDVERAEAAGGAVEREGGEVGEGADLVLGLEPVGVVGGGGMGQLVPATPSCHEFLRCLMPFQVRRKGSSRLLTTVTRRLSLVTQSMRGPGRRPLIRMPCHGWLQLGQLDDAAAMAVATAGRQALQAAGGYGDRDAI